jgi:hypothetical protein
MILPTALSSMGKADVPALKEEKNWQGHPHTTQIWTSATTKPPSEVTMCAQILEFKQLRIPVTLHIFIQYADSHSPQVIFYTNSLPSS